jgi:hypothetical protein
MSKKFKITAESSHGDFTFDETGRIVDFNLLDSFTPQPILQVDMESINEDDVCYRDTSGEHGDIDVLYVGYFYLDEYGRRQYEPKLDDPRCPNCHAVFSAECSCYPKALLSGRNTLYINGKEQTQAETIEVMNPVRVPKYNRGLQ